MNHDAPRHTVKSDYLTCALDIERTKKSVKGVIRAIEKSGVQFDAIVLRGMSGALIAPIVGYLLQKPVIIVRKEGSHSPRRIDGSCSFHSFIIIDDFICSGDTISITLNTLFEEANSEGIKIECSGIFLYKFTNSDVDSEQPGKQWTHWENKTNIPIFCRRDK